MLIKNIVPWTLKDQSLEVQSHKVHPITKLQDEITLAFSQFRKHCEQLVGRLKWPWNGGDARSNSIESGKTFEVSIDLPGMGLKDIEVSVSDNVLVIKGEKKIERQEERNGYYLSERKYGAIYRTIPLPPNIDHEKAEATFKNGMLTITLPQTMKDKTKTKRIKVIST